MPALPGGEPERVATRTPLEALVTAQDAYGRPCCDGNTDPEVFKGTPQGAPGT
jgi:hypothetical protein